MVSSNQNPNQDHSHPPTYTYRPVQPARDRLALCQLFHQVFPHSCTTPTLWRWKYQGSPAGGTGIVVQEPRHQHIVGHIGVVWLPGLQNGQPLLMGQVCDVMIAPEHRADIGASSIYRQMNHALAEHLRTSYGTSTPYLFGFPGRAPANLGIRIGVYRRLQVCKQYLYPYQPPPSSQHVENNTWHSQPLDVQRSGHPGGGLSHLLNAIWHAVQTERHNSATHSSSTAAPFIVKNAQYLRWRYLDHPAQRQALARGHTPPYHIHLLYPPGQQHPMGWLVTRQSPQAIVVDSCLPPSLPIGQALQALPAPAPGQSGWHTWLPAPAGASPGYSSATNSAVHAVHILGSSAHSQWHSPAFEPGDTDVF